MITISDILDYLTGSGIETTYIGDSAIEINGFSSLNNYKRGTITWIKTQEAAERIQDSASIELAVVQNGVKTDIENTLYSDNSKAVFFGILEHFYGDKDEHPLIGEGTYISPKVKIGNNVRVGHNCTLDGDIIIGDNTVIWNNVTIINNVRIGSDCTIYSGCVIGHDGFSYTENEFHEKKMVKHFGGVSIGSNVHIGENTCICRGTIDDTIIRDGVRIDAMTHIAHNCSIGENTTIIAGNIFGSVSIEENAYIANATVRNHISIGEKAFIGMGSVVVKDVETGQTVAGVPAKPFKK